MRSDDGVFLFKFASNEGLEQLLQRGPWMIRKSLIILTKWSSKLSLKKGEVTCISVWVKLHGVPILAYSEDRLSLISTQIGKPLLLDDFTSDMCVESRGRISFAHALIEVSSESVLKNEVVMDFPNEEGDGYTKEVIKVEYEWKPPHCVDCKIFRHSLINCPKRAKETTSSAPFVAATNTARVEDCEEGFIEGVGNVHAKASSLKSNDNRKSSPFCVKSTMSTPLANTFDVFSSVEEDICGTSIQGMTQVDGDGGHNPKVFEKVQEKGSLWSRLKEMKEASTSKAKSTMVDLTDASNEDEVFLPEDYSNGGGFNLDEDDLDCYDRYEAQVYDLSEKMHAFLEWETLYQKQTGSCKNGRLGSCKSARRIPKGLIHVQASFNNTIVTVIEVRGNAILTVVEQGATEPEDRSTILLLMSSPSIPIVGPLESDIRQRDKGLQVLTELPFNARLLSSTKIMDPNSSLRKIFLGDDVIVISSDKVEGSGDWNSLEYQDTNVCKGAFDGEVNLAFDENLISNEFAVKLCLDYEVKKGKKLVKKELIVALKGELYFVKFIINPEERRF
ncbi:reverse transcriptase domain-containing protein [Tanacetum coccineum]